MDSDQLDNCRSTRQQRGFIIGLILLALVLSLQYYFKTGGFGSRSTRSAFLRWREQILQLQSDDIYQRFAYPNPPIMALILRPLAELPPLLGSLSWFYLKLGMALAAFWWVFRLVEGDGPPLPAWAKGLTILLSLRPVMGDLSHGNVNLFILFLVIGALFALNHRRDWLAGGTLALAIACKVTPALFIPYFLWKRAWRVLAGCTAGLILFLILVPGLILGNQRNMQLLGSWVNQMVTPYVANGTVTSEHQNQSLPGLVFRLATHHPSFLNEKGEPDRYDNVLDLPPQTATWLIKGAMAAFAGLVIWFCRTPLRVRGGWRISAEWGLVLLGMLLFSERTWKHHCVTLVLPFAVIAYHLSVCRPSPWLRGYLYTSLALAGLLMMTTSTGILEPLDEAGKAAQVYGAYVWANLILVAALLVLLRRPLDRTALQALPEIDRPKWPLENAA